MDLTPTQHGERVAYEMYLRRLEADRRDNEFDMGAPLEGEYEPEVVRMPRDNDVIPPAPCLVMDASGKVIATIDPITRERRPV